MRNAQTAFPHLIQTLAAAAILALAVALPTEAASAEDESLTFRGQLSWINAVQHTQLLESAVNPDNQLLAVPADTAVSEFRPNLKITASNLQLVARPRVHVEVSEATVAGKKRAAEGKTDSVVNEAFAQWTVNEGVTFVYGLQSYQWGSAESLSPSNRIFHETAQQRTVLYEVRGKNIARVNFSLGKQFSTVLMAETKANPDEPAFVADQEFQSAGLIKSEYSWHEGSDYFGLVLGGKEHGNPWVGEYFSYGLPFFDGLSVFADASQQRGSEAWYPVVQGPVTVFQQAHLDERKSYNLAVAGLKYDFVNGTILRGEYILNQAGWTADEHDLALAALKPKSQPEFAVLADNTRRFLTPGLDLPGQRYAYASLHVPDLFTIIDLVLDARSLYSLTDRTSSSYASLDYKVGDAGTATVATGATAGKKDGELKSYASPTYTVAYRHDW